jgi:hypothetical protein
MDIVYTWSIYNVHYAPALSNQTNVITNVSWTLLGTYTDAQGNQFEEESLGTSVFKFDESNPFVPFEQVGKEVIQSWIEAKENLKKRDIAWRKADIAKKIAEKVNPSVIILKNPFGDIHPTTGTQTVI